MFVNHCWCPFVATLTSLLIGALALTRNVSRASFISSPRVVSFSPNLVILFSQLHLMINIQQILPLEFYLECLLIHPGLKNRMLHSFLSHLTIAVQLEQSTYILLSVLCRELGICEIFKYRDF